MPKPNHPLGRHSVDSNVWHNATFRTAWTCELPNGEGWIALIVSQALVSLISKDPRVLDDRVSTKYSQENLFSKLKKNLFVNQREFLDHNRIEHIGERITDALCTFNMGSHGTSVSCTHENLIFNLQSLLPGLPGINTTSRFCADGQSERRIGAAFLVGARGLEEISSPFLLHNAMVCMHPWDSIDSQYLHDAPVVFRYICLCDLKLPSKRSHKTRLSTMKQDLKLFAKLCPENQKPTKIGPVTIPYLKALTALSEELSIPKNKTLLDLRDTIYNHKKRAVRLMLAPYLRYCHRVELADPAVRYDMKGDFLVEMANRRFDMLIRGSIVHTKYKGAGHSYTIRQMTYGVDGESDETRGAVEADWLPKGKVIQNARNYEAERWLADKICKETETFDVVLHDHPYDSHRLAFCAGQIRALHRTKELVVAMTSVRDILLENTRLVFLDAHLMSSRQICEAIRRRCETKSLPKLKDVHLYGITRGPCPSSPDAGTLFRDLFYSMGTSICDAHTGNPTCNRLSAHTGRLGLRSETRVKLVRSLAGPFLPPDRMKIDGHPKMSSGNPRLHDYHVYMITAGFDLIFGTDRDAITKHFFTDQFSKHCGPFRNEIASFLACDAERVCHPYDSAIPMPMSPTKILLICRVTVTGHILSPTHDQLLRTITCLDQSNHAEIWMVFLKGVAFDSTQIRSIGMPTKLCFPFLPDNSTLVTLMYSYFQERKVLSRVSIPEDESSMETLEFPLASGTRIPCAKYVDISSIFH